MSTAGGGARRGWASSDDYVFLSLIVIVIGCGFLGWMLWSNYHPEVVEAVAWLQIRKMTLIGRFTDGYEALRQGAQALDLGGIERLRPGMDRLAKQP